MTPDDGGGEPKAPKSRGHGNAILTWAKVEELVLGIQRVDSKLEVQSAKFDDLKDDITGMDKQYLDHEHRLRVLEKAEAGRAGGSKAVAFIYHAIWPMAAVLISAFAYLNNN